MAELSAKLPPLVHLLPPLLENGSLQGDVVCSEMLNRLLKLGGSLRVSKWVSLLDLVQPHPSPRATADDPLRRPSPSSTPRRRSLTATTSSSRPNWPLFRLPPSTRLRSRSRPSHRSMLLLTIAPARKCERPLKVPQARRQGRVAGLLDLEGSKGGPCCTPAAKRSNRGFARAAKR